MDKHKLISDFIDFLIEQQGDDEEQRGIMMEMMELFLDKQ